MDENTNVDNTVANEDTPTEDQTTETTETTDTSDTDTPETEEAPAAADTSYEVEANKTANGLG